MNIFPTVISLLTQHKWDSRLFEYILKFLFALKESRNSFDFLEESFDGEIFQKLLQKVYYGYNLDDSEDSGSRDISHNFYILCSQLAKFNRSFDEAIRNVQFMNVDFQEVFKYYEVNTAQIEIVKSDRTMEEILFPIPKICGQLSEDAKSKIFITCEQDDQGSKVNFNF